MAFATEKVLKWINPSIDFFKTDAFLEKTNDGKDQQSVIIPAAYPSVEHS